MVKRRYGIISENGKFIANSNTDIINSCLNNRDKTISNFVDKFVDAYNEAFDYSCSLNCNVAFSLKKNEKFCIWEMNNKEDTYKEFMI